MEEELSHFDEIQRYIALHANGLNDINLQFANMVEEFYRQVILVCGRHPSGQSNPLKLLEQLVSMRARVDSVVHQEFFNYLPLFIQDMMQLDRWQNDLVALQLLRRLQVHQIDYDAAAIAPIFLERVLKWFESPSEQLRTSCLEVFRIKDIDMDTRGDLVKDICTRLKQLRTGQSKPPLKEVLATINEQSNLSWGYTYGSTAKELSYFTVLAEAGAEDALLWVDALEYSDSRIRMLGVTQIKQSLAAHQRQSIYYDQLLDLLPLLLLDENIAIRLEACQIINSFSELSLSAEEKELLAERLLSQLFFNNQIDQLKQESTQCCILITNNQLRPYIGKYIHQIVNICLLEWHNNQQTLKAGLSTLGRLLYLKDYIPPVANQLCSLIRLMCESEEFFPTVLKQIIPQFPAKFDQTILSQDNFMLLTFEAALKPFTRASLAAVQVDAKEIFSKLLKEYGEAKFIEKLAFYIGQCCPDRPDLNEKILIAAKQIKPVPKK